MLATSSHRKNLTPAATHNGFDDDSVLHAISAGTASQTGKQFFAALVQNLAQAMQTYGAWVTEYFPEEQRLRALAFWFGEKFIPDFEHDIAGTVCETVVERRELVHIADNLLRLYPAENDFKEAGVVSYMGVPLLDLRGKVLGHLAIVDTKPMPKKPRAVAIFQIFAARAAAELQRMYVETELREKNAQLEKAQALLAEENRRKSEELKTARHMQRAMLPNKFPALPHLEIEAYMKTASEVGGDYYDYHLGQDGALTVMIGDATGHGLNAGMMVTAAKSVLAALRAEPDLVKIFQRANEALMRVNLHRHYMALQMLKLHGERVEVCSAGMPPLLLYRAAAQTVEEVRLKAMPLGSAANFPYQQREFKIAAGDTILLMSDGLPELFNAEGETFEEERVKAAFAQVAAQAPKDVIAHLTRAAKAWAKGERRRDDMTFVVIKAR